MKLPLEARSYYANSDYYDPMMEWEYARNRGIGPEHADIRAARIDEFPELVNVSDAEIELIGRNMSASFNNLLNQATRGGDESLLERYDIEIRTLVGAYNKLPDHIGTVYRSMRIDDPAELDVFLEAYRSGNVVRDSGFSCGDKLAAMAGNVELIINSRHGKDISWASDERDEVVFPPGTRFRVESVVPGDTRIYIHLDELGRNPDAYQPRGLGDDHAKSAGAQHDTAPAAASGDRSGDGDDRGDGGERTTPGDRGPDADLAGMDGFGTAPDRPRRTGTSLNLP